MQQEKASAEIKLGVLSPSSHLREVLREQVSQTGVASVVLELDQYCSGRADFSLRMENTPDIFLIDMQDPRRAMESIQLLHLLLPETWILVSAESEDSNLIIEAMRSGAREFLPQPVESRGLIQAIQRYLVEKKKEGGTETLGEIFCVTAAKGGSGATSLAVNLAVSLAEASPKGVGLIDLKEPLGDLGIHMNVKPQFTILDTLASASRLDSVLLDSYMSDSYGISVLPGSKDFRSTPPRDSDALAKILKVARRTYAHVLVDLPVPTGEREMRLVGEMADVLIFVLTPELPAIWRTKRFLEAFAPWSDPERLRLVLNCSQSTDEIRRVDIEEVLNFPVFWELPYSNAAVQAINSGKPLVSINHSKLSHEYRGLACKLAGIAAPKKRHKFFGVFS